MTVAAKKIAVALPYAVSIRDFVSSGALAELLRDSQNTVFVYTLNPDIPELDSAKKNGAQVRAFAQYKDSLPERLIKSVYPLFFEDHFAYVRISLSDRLYLKCLSKILSAIRRLMGTRRLLGAIGTILLAIYRWRRPARQLENGLALFVGTRSLINSLDYGLIAEATLRGVRILTIAGSWDNFTTKGFFPFPAHRTIVWNKKMQQELVDLFEVPAQKIHVAGYPRASLLRNAVDDIPAESYLQSIGIPGYSRFILYSASYSELTRISQQPAPLEYLVIISLCEQLLDVLPEDVCIVIRLHPFSSDADVHLFDRLKRCFTFVPGRKDKYVERVMGHGDERHLALQIAKSACIVSMASTISIDALSLGRPVINVKFDPVAELPYTSSIVRFYDFNHFRDLIRIANLPTAKSPAEVIEFVQSCLQERYQPAVDFDAFKALYVPMDSHEYPRIVRQIVGELVDE